MWEPSEEFLHKFRYLQQREKEEKRQRKKQAMSKARKAAGHLKAKWGVDKVYLYGSLAWGTFHERSDIDLMVVGFKGDYWRMLVEIEEITFPFECTVVCEEDAFPSLRERVYAEGVKLD